VNAAFRSSVGSIRRECLDHLIVMNVNRSVAETVPAIVPVHWRVSRQ